MYAIYDLALALAGLVIVPALGLPRFRAHRERLGGYPAELRERLRGHPVLWLHSASVGEMLASRLLLRRFHEAWPQWRIVLSTTSFAGRALARDLPEAAGAVLLPFDLSRCVERAIDGLRPSLFVFTETELWPNLLRALARRRIPSLMVSGRVSPRAFRRYRWVRPFVRRVLADVTLFGMQSEQDSARIRALGAPPERVRVTGSLKDEAAGEPARAAVAAGHALWIAASTHAGEEAICLRVHARLRADRPDLRLLLAPRHLDRRADVERVIERSGLSHTRRTALGDATWSGDSDVLLLDTLGELAGLYPGAFAAFVGGSLAAVGGHNLLEPARAAVPVLFGPRVESVADVAAALEAGGGGARVRDEAELEAKLRELAADPGLVRRMGGAARAVCAPAGAVETSLRAAAELIGGSPSVSCVASP